jgi:hypothetical protein
MGCCQAGEAAELGRLAQGGEGHPAAHVRLYVCVHRKRLVTHMYG